MGYCELCKSSICQGHNEPNSSFLSFLRAGSEDWMLEP